MKRKKKLFGPDEFHSRGIPTESYQREKDKKGLRRMKYEAGYTVAPSREIFQTPVLRSTLDYIKTRGEQGLYLLPDTGFQVKTQIDLLINNYKKGIPLSDSFQQLEQDVQGFKTEYLVEQPVFPIVLEKAKHEGKMRLVGKLYGGKPLVDATDSAERDGEVKKSIQKIEEYLLTALPGSMAVMTSPKGWSGYTGIEYPDSQTYCFQVQPDGGVRGFTLKTDMTLGQNKELLGKLGVDKEVFNDPKDLRDDIRRVVENVVFIDPKEDKSIEYIAQTIKEIKGSNVAYKDSAGNSRTFSEMMRLLQSPESLWTLDTITKRLIDQLKTYGSYRIMSIDGQTEQDLQIALGYTVLKLMHEIRPSIKAQEMNSGEKYFVSEKISIQFDPYDTLEKLQKIGGCAGGGKQKSIIDSITPRLSNILDNTTEWFSCPKCQYKADGPIGDTCPGCNLTKEEYAQEEGAVVCN